MHQEDENLTENHTTPMVSEIQTKLTINEENSRLFTNSILEKGKPKVETS